MKLFKMTTFSYVITVKVYFHNPASMYLEKIKKKKTSTEHKAMFNFEKFRRTNVL